jgi:hypothetical protein
MPQNDTPFLGQPCGDPVGGLVPGGPYGTFRIISVDASGNVNVNVVSGGGGGTSNTNLIEVAGAAITLGQTTMASSLPVTIASNQSAIPVSGTVAVTQSTTPWVVSLASTTITGSVAVTGTFFQATQPVSGTVTVNQGTSPWVVSLASTTITGTVAVTQSTSPWVVSNSGTFAVQAAITTLGQQLAAASVPVVLTASQLSTLTPLSTITVNQGTSPWVVSVTSTTITGTVAVTQGTSPWVVSLASTTISGTVSVTQGTSPWVVSLTSTTVTNTVAENLIQVAGVTLGATAVVNYGSTPAAVAVPAVNAFITNTVPVTLTSTTITGTVAVTQSTSPWVVSLASTTITNTVAVTGALTNNNAAPTPTLLGVLGAIAETAYATITYTTGDMVLPVTDLHGALNHDLQALAGTALGGPTTWGTAPTAEQVQGVNADCFQSTSPWVVSLASTTITGTVAVTQSTSPWVVSLASTTITNTVSIQGNLTNNNAAPNAFNLGVLPAIAETAYATVTYTTGDQVLPVTDLHGALNTDLQAVGGVAVVSAAAGVQKVGISGATGVTLDAAQNASAPANELVVGGTFNTTIPALTAGNSSQLQLDSTGALAVNCEGRKQTYRMSVAGFTPPTVVAGSPFFSIQGSATKTVRITQIRVSWAATTGQTTPAILSLQRFSALTGGTTGNTPTGALNDTTNAAQTAVCLQYSVEPSTHTAVGGISAAENISWITGSVSVVNQTAIQWQFGNAQGQELVLRGIAQYFGILVSANGSGTPTMSVSIEWTEE